MSIDLFKKRIERIVGKLPEGSFIPIDKGQWVVKPNLYSHSGTIIGGETLSCASYGAMHCAPVSIGYGLDQDQSTIVLGKCLKICDEIDICLKDDDLESARDLCKMVIADVCAVLTSAKDKDDVTVSDLIRRMPKNARQNYYKIINCLNKVKGFNKDFYLENCCHKMSIPKGKFSGEFIEKNKEQLLKDMRESFIPFMGNSTLEQDHWGMDTVDDETLLGAEDVFNTKKEVLGYSPIHAGGLNTVKERTGLNLKFIKSIDDPLKKKKAFSKAVSVMDVLGRVDDPRLEDAFTKLWGRLGLDQEGVDWNRIIAVDPGKSPIIVPIIFESEDINFPTDYSPIQALEVMNSLTDITNYSNGSNNLSLEENFDKSSLYGEDDDDQSDSAFPFGAAAPFSPPRRVKEEVV